MFRILGPVLGLLVILNVAGCASYFKRKECEKTNWFQHGHDVAMSGKRLDADPFAKECQKVEAKMSFSDMDTGFKAGMAKYCTGDNVFNVGKAGKPFAYDMCDGENEKKMRARYIEGVRQFCVSENGYHFGAGGGVYQNVCPKEMERAFVTEYRKGRKVYLNLMIDEKTKESERLTSQTQSLEMQRMNLQGQRASLSGRTVMKTEQVLDTKSGTYQSRTTQVPDESAQARVRDLDSQISNLDHQIRSNKAKQQTLAAEVTQMKTEVISL